MLADRDYKTFDFWNGKNGKFAGGRPKDTPESWPLWFAYWLGREHGRDTAINNARIMLKRQEEGYDKKKGIVKTFLEALWIIPPS